MPRGVDKRLSMRYIYVTAMKMGSQDYAQAMQRVRVGMTGLAVVVVLIGLASVIPTSANRERPITAVGASNVTVVADIADTSNGSEMKNSEPLAEIGVAPSTQLGNSSAARSNDAGR